MASKKFDVLILGGGVVGMSTACHLAMRGVCNKLKVAVVEKDSTYSQASAMLSAGGMRQQFSLEDNVKMSLYGVDFIRRMRSWPSAADVQFKEQGYVFLAKSDEGVEILRQNHLIQTGAGANIQLLPTRDLQAKFPWMDTSEIKLGSFGSSGEGWFDPWTLLNNMKRRALEGGVAVIDGSLQSLDLDDSSCSINHANIQDKGGHIHQMTAGTYIMTAGAWAAHSCMDDLVSRMGGLGAFDHWPVRPKKRCIFSFHCPSALEQGIDRGGLTVDPSGVYFRPEGKGSSNFICGVSPPSDRDKDVNQLDTQDVDHELFEGVIWPTLAARVPAFQEIKLKRWWAGLYEYSTLDQNAFIGAMPGLPNLLICNGFSGHGLQQSPAAGRAISELVLDGKYTSLDLSIFGCERLLTNPPTQVLERNIV